jgi:putative transposase
MRIDLSVTEFKELCKSIQKRPKKLFKMMRQEIRETTGQYLSELIQVELTDFLGRLPYERVKGDGNHRNGCYHRRFTLKGIGEVLVRMARDRKGKFQSQVLPKSKRYEDELRQDICVMYLTGISTRTLSMISEKLLGRKISAGEVSRVSKQLVDSVEQWRMRDLSGERIKYLFIDGVNFKMRVTDSVENVPVLVVIGVREDGQRLVLGFQAGNKESASTWREFFKDLKRRGLRGELVKLGVMDGLRALESVFREEFANAEVQRCQIHVTCNVLAKVPAKLKKEVADDLRSIFYAPSLEKAKELYQAFGNRWQREVPSAVKCLSSSIDSCLTFFKYPPEEWISLRTTNIIERLNKEFKRRTKVMEIVAGEKACYNLLAFICLKMELHWRKSPMGKVLTAMFRPHLLTSNEFTQNA